MGHPGLLAAAVLTIATEHTREPGPANQIPLTRNEIAHLLSAVTVRPRRDASYRMRWSQWRRRHQHRTRACRYRRQTAREP